MEGAIANVDQTWGAMNFLKRYATLRCAFHSSTQRLHYDCFANYRPFRCLVATRPCQLYFVFTGSITFLLIWQNN